VALQGTLETFALPDVLRLLASTKKTGCYRLNGDRGSAALWIDEGMIVGGEVASPHVDDLGEVAFEMMRFKDGEFEFEADGEINHSSEPSDVETVLEAAQTMLAEWQSIESIVPSLQHWVSLRPDLAEDEVTIRADKWISVVAIGSGTTVARLGTVLGLSELPVSRNVKELLEMGIVELGDAPPAGAVVPVQAAPNLADPVRVFPAGLDVEPSPAYPTGDYPDITHTDTGFAGSDGGYTTSDMGYAGSDDQPDAEPDEFTTFDPNALLIDDLHLTGPTAVATPGAQHQLDDGYGSGSFDPAGPGSDPSDTDTELQATLVDPDPFDSGSDLLDRADRLDRHQPQDDYRDFEAERFPPPPAPSPIVAPVSPLSPGPTTGPITGIGEADTTDAAEIARQLANLSPRAAKAVAAAAKATTQEEREAALAEVDESEDPINRELLLKFLGSVNS
jgi:hypothetical protein